MTDEYGYADWDADERQAEAEDLRARLAALEGEGLSPTGQSPEPADDAWLAKLDAATTQQEMVAVMAERDRAVEEAGLAAHVEGLRAQAKAALAAKGFADPAEAMNAAQSPEDVMVAARAAGIPIAADYD